MKILGLILCFFFGISFQSHCQDGPGSVGSTDGTSSLKMWLKSSDLADDINEGELVLNWKDNSGSSNHVQTTPQIAPTWEKNEDNPFLGVRFYGNEYLQTAATSTDFSPTHATIFIVSSGLNTGTPISIANNSWNDEILMFNQQIYHHSFSGNFTYTDIDCTTVVPSQEISISCGVFGTSPNDLTYIFNGMEGTNELNQAGEPQDYNIIDRLVTIGQRDQFVSSEFFVGFIYEVIVYNSKLTEDEIFRVEEYLRCRYDLEPTICESLNDEACVITAVQNFDNKLNINLSPNPASQILNISSNINKIDQLNYFIYDLSGQEISKVTISNNQTKIDISELNAGIYFIKIQLDNQYEIQKFIVE